MVTIKRELTRRQTAAVAVALAGAAAALYYASLISKKPSHSSKMTGQEWLEELEDRPTRFYNRLGMNRHVFMKLVDVLRTKAGIKDTKHVTAHEQLAIFLYMAVTGSSTRKTQERFQRSGDTVSKVFHRILDPLTSSEMYFAYVKLPGNTTPDEIATNPKFYPFFKDVVGAIGGTHIPAFVPENDHARFRNRKGDITQNVLAACTFDLQFSYILSGWEGCASDGLVYQSARSNGLLIPDGKYYLANAGFPSCDSLLVPYRGVQYHQQEWDEVAKRPRTSQELYNLHHSQTQNVIDRTFALVKKRFKMLTSAPEYTVHVQARLVTALCLLHNFIRIHDPEDRAEWEADNGPDNDAHEIDQDSSGNLGAKFTQTEGDCASKRRDEIAEAMWTSYMETCSTATGG